MTLLIAILSSVAILPSDRMAMADRLFDRGSYAEAKAEYVSLKGLKGISEDELIYRLAECARATGDKNAARASYKELLDCYPLSRHAASSRLMRALSGTANEQKVELKALDSDSIDAKIRATALYHLGVLTNDADMLARCVKLDPNGRYAPYAKFRGAVISAQSKDAAIRRAAVSTLMDIHFGKDKELSKEALYIASTQVYSEKRYSEASSLFRRFMKIYPDDSRISSVKIMAAWSDYLAGKYADAIALCGVGDTDDTAYLIAACAYATGDKENAKKRMLAYLEKYPTGKYRKSVELPLARMDFDQAEKGDDTNKAIEAAKRGALLSKSASDRLRLAWAYEKANKTNEAVAEYVAVARNFPGTDDAAEALFRKAMIDLRAKNWSPAELALAEALSSGKNLKRKPSALYWRGVAASMLGHGAKSIEFLKEALATKGLTLDETREAKLLLADADFKSGKVAEAKASYIALVREGACDRMTAAKMRSVGRFLIDSKYGTPAIEEAKICARSLLVHADTPEWRQSAYALKGQTEELANEFNVAIESYRNCMAEKVRTEDAKEVALSLGILESKAGNHSEADRVLKEAVQLNSKNSAVRAKAYLWLAKTCEAMTDYRGACAYATVIMTLFDNRELMAEAQKILDAHPEEAK